MYEILKDFGLPAYLVGIIILVSVAYKRIKEHQAKRLNSTKEQLEAIVNLVSDTEKMKNKFLVEQVFIYKFGAYIPYSVIKMLLEFNNPTEAIRNWILAKRHLVILLNPTRLEYREKILKQKNRQIWTLVNIGGYFVFASAGLGLLFSLPKIFDAVHYAWFIGSGVFVFYLLFVAYEFVMSTLRIKAAEEIMGEVQCTEKHNS